MPGLAVEELVALLEADGFDCRFDPATDIPPSWGCQSGDGAEGSLSVSMLSEQTGQIHSASAYLQIGAVGEEVPEDRLDAEATQGFHPFVSAIVPEEHRPSLDELGAGVRSNFPMDLGGGWYLGFDRNIISRSLTIIFSEE